MTIGTAAAPEESKGTEWNDILKEKGILTSQDIEEIVDKVLEERQGTAKTSNLGEKEVADLDLDDLDLLLDEGPEDFGIDGHGSTVSSAVLEKYREKRLEELKAISSLPTYASPSTSTLLQISKSQYNQHVTTHPGVVILLLHQSYITTSVQLFRILVQLSIKHPHVKFLTIKADECIESYPDRNVPTLLVYRKGEALAQCVGTGLVGGPNQMTLHNVEIYLRGIGAFQDEPEMNGKGGSLLKRREEEEEEEEEGRPSYIRSAFRTIRKGDNNEDDSD